MHGRMVLPRVTKGGLKEQALRGGLAKLFGQAANVLIRLLYLSVMARLLSPGDFGLVAMVTVVTGLFDIFTAAGLSWAVIQKDEINEHQISQLFWINICVGMILTLACAASAPVLTAFYGDSHLFWVVLALAPGFLLSAGGVQHSAVLQRDLRYLTLTVIDLIAQLGGAALGICMALAGYGYWGLVAALLVSPMLNTAGCWICANWLPGRPRWGGEIFSLLSFGGILTLNGIVVYAGYNVEKVILGRYWGSDVLGLYTRAVQLVNLPVTGINSAVGGVIFSVLSRLQNDPQGFRNFFIKSYSLVMTVTVPFTLFFAVFADEIVRVVLGPQWSAAATIFRLMTPTILVFGIINPLGWMLMALGLQKRSLYLGLIIAPLVMVGYSFGLRYGPNGVACGYSVVMLLWLFPHVAWSLRGTPVSVTDLLKAMSGPFLSGAVAAVCAILICRHLDHQLPVVLQLAVGGLTMGGIYGAVLFFAGGYRTLYVDVLATLRRRSEPTLP